MATVEEAINSNSPALATMKKEYGETVMVAILVLFITDAVKYFSVGKSMDDNQVVQTSKLIFKDYFYMKPEDFKLCFNNAKRGVYGTMYDRIDGAVIFGWLQKYSDSRLNRAEEINTEKHNEGKAIDNLVNRFFQARKGEQEKEFHKVVVDEYRKTVHNQPTQP